MPTYASRPSALLEAAAEASSSSSLVPADSLVFRMERRAAAFASLTTPVAVWKQTGLLASLAALPSLLGQRCAILRPAGPVRACIAHADCRTDAIQGLAGEMQAFAAG
jgi:hypothetical protein